MEDPINLDRTSATRVAPPELEIYQSHKQPSTQEAHFELELYISHKQSSTQESRFDDDTRKPEGRNGTPCNSLEHGSQPTEVELKNPSSAVKSTNGTDLCRHASLTVSDFLHWTYIDDWQTLPNRQHQLPTGRKRLETRLLPVVQTK